MSPLPSQVVIDNDVVSRLHSAGVLERILRLWPKGSFCITEQVIEEAKKWRTEGNRVEAILKKLLNEGILTLVTIETEEEVWTYAELALPTMTRIGRGESASIAIAHHRRLAVATDDSTARTKCKLLDPAIPILGTGTILNIAVADGILDSREAQAIKARIHTAAR